MGLPILFVVVSVAELAVLAAVEGRIGLGATLLAILVTGVVGAALVRRQGLGTLAAIRRQMQDGVFPGRELAHAALVLVGGALLLTPGFLTDAAGLALMVPAAREAVRKRSARYLRDRVSIR